MITAISNAITNIPPTSLKNYDGEYVSAVAMITAATPVGTYDLTTPISSILPSDNYDYELHINAEVYNSGSTYSHIFLSSTKTSAIYVACVGTNSREQIIDTNIVVGADRKLTMQITTNACVWNSHDGRQGLYVVGFRRIGTNK